MPLQHYLTVGPKILLRICQFGVVDRLGCHTTNTTNTRYRMGYPLLCSTA